MTDAKPITIRLNAADNVVVARTDILPGTEIPGEGVLALAQIPAGHKIATAPIGAGEAIRKYNQIIGFAIQDVAPGGHLHVQNMEMQTFERDYAHSTEARATEFVPLGNQATFQGYRRHNGKVATRNYIGVLTSVNCSATVARYIAESVNRDVLGDYPNVDGVVACVHGTGCGMADSGGGYENLQRTLWGFARHPNFGGILMVGLGCEVNQIDFLLEAYGIERGPKFRTMTIQDTGGTRKTVARGVELIKEMLPEANKISREAVPASELTLALQCGGSDAYSGITANPSLGAAVDLLVQNGGYRHPQ